jgi:RNA polymerase sigma factor, sigma-70 family
MSDDEIVELYWVRSELAISETSKKFNNYCFRIASNILDNHEDVEECINDVYLQTRNSIPEHRPLILSTYLGKITRNLAITMYRYYKRNKRNPKNATILLDELNDCIPSTQSVGKEMEDKFIAEVINRFLYSLSEIDCNLFIRRYWYLDSIKSIAEFYDMSESKIKSKLFRIRNRLKIYLEKEGINL